MYDVYKVNNGDTIEPIALKFNTTPQIIYDINSFNPMTDINTLEYIVVPSSKLQIFEYYTVNSGDTISSIARKYNTTVEIISSINGLKEGEYIYQNEILLIPKEGVKTYLTKNGDTLKEILKKIEANLAQLNAQNPNIYLQPEQLIVYKYK